MIKRLLIISGIAIVAVVCNHAAGWGYTALFWWSHRYSSILPPNLDQVGSASYFLLGILRQLSVFAVPSFLFISGIFIAYASKNRDGGLTWKMVWMRIKYLLIPYVIWSLVIFFGEYFQGVVYSPIEYIKRLMFGEASPGYFFVIMLIQFYVLSPFLVAAMMKKRKATIVIVALLQIFVVLISYPVLFMSDYASFFQIPKWSFVRMILYFPLGIFFGMESQSVIRSITKVKWLLLISSAFFGFLVILEHELLYRKSDLFYGATHHSMTGILYSTAVILTFLAFSDSPIRFSKGIMRLGTITFGIYLIHPIVLELCARLIYHISPGLLPLQYIFQPLLISIAIGVPILMMKFVSNSPFRKLYRYVFG